MPSSLLPTTENENRRTRVKGTVCHGGSERNCRVSLSVPVFPKGHSEMTRTTYSGSYIEHGLGGPLKCVRPNLRFSDWRDRVPDLVRSCSRSRKCGEQTHCPTFHIRKTEARRTDGLGSFDSVLGTRRGYPPLRSRHEA